MRLRPLPYLAAAAFLAAASPPWSLGHAGSRPPLRLPLLGKPPQTAPIALLLDVVTRGRVVGDFALPQSAYRHGVVTLPALPPVRPGTYLLVAVVEWPQGQFFTSRPILAQVGAPRRGSP